MKKVMKYFLLIMIITAAAAAGYSSLRSRSVSMKNLITVSNAPEGNCIVSWYEKDKLIVSKVSPGGKIEKYISYDSVSGKEMKSVVGIAAGVGDTVYMLMNIRDAFTGKTIEQRLAILDFGGMVAKEKKSFILTNEEENYDYRWINVSGETITLIATDQYEGTAIRRTVEYGSLLEGTLNIKNTRTYPLAEEGIYLAVGNSTNLAYISDSGKIYRADEENVTEVYPARELNALIYPTFLAYAESGFVYFGEHESGNIIKLNLTTGEEEVAVLGGSALNGASLYTPKDFVQMSMSGLNTYTAVVCDGKEEEYRILSVSEGASQLIQELSYSMGATLLRFAAGFVTVFAGGWVLFFGVWLILTGIRNGRTIMGRLVVVSAPLIIIAMSLFGVIAYQYYKGAIQENFEKQVMDEGNMMAALFGQESFNEIEYPFDYTKEAYGYLKQQLATRELYTRILYYEGNELYIGVDDNSPCFYPVDIWMNGEAKSLYKEAALTGTATIGYIRDKLGERLVCITPVGGLSGQTVYLLETGIFTSNVDSYMKSYVKNFAVVCVAFLIIILVILSIFFYRILSPINEMKWVMGSFVEGNQEARILVKSEDELAGISRVFNKMADDTIMQIHHLEKMTETYYHFMPTSIIGLLDKDNLAELTLGSRMTGEYVLMHVTARFSRQMDEKDSETIANRFFVALNKFAVKNDVIPIVDNADISHIMLICQNGADDAINAALSILAKIDSDNMLCRPQERLKIAFFAHKARINFSICGDENRYIPALFSPQMQKALWHRDFYFEMGSRILITEQVFSDITQTGAYENRYIGTVAMEEGQVRIFDIYDDKSAEEIKSMKHTQPAFDKAMALYEEGYYYEAKNLFTLVLRENKEDMAAKYYIFKCEELQNTK